MMDERRLRIGYIPLVAAAALIVAADAGFAHTEGLDIELVRSRAPGPTNRSTASGSLPDAFHPDHIFDRAGYRCGCCALHASASVCPIFALHNHFAIDCPGA